MVTVKALLFLAPALIFATSCISDAESGTVTGKVKIGPISPVQRIGVEEVVPPEMYAAYRIVVFQDGKTKEMARTKISAKGGFELRLPAGNYEIGWEPAQPSPKMPQRRVKVRVEAGKRVKVDVEIDTGIR